VPPGAGEENSEAEREDRSRRARGEDRRADGRWPGRLLGGGDHADVDVVEHGRVGGQVEAAHAPPDDEDGGELGERAAGELLEAVPPGAGEEDSVVRGNDRRADGRWGGAGLGEDWRAGGCAGLDRHL
jgi:hypothetical protein